MKRLFIASIICFGTITSMGQSKYADSLKILIANANSPIEKFDLLNKLGEGLFSGSDVKVDSAFCMQLYARLARVMMHVEEHGGCSSIG